MFKLTCPSCTHAVDVKFARVGGIATCTRCGHRYRVEPESLEITPDIAPKKVAWENDVDSNSQEMDSLAQAQLAADDVPTWQRAHLSRPGNTAACRRVVMRSSGYDRRLWLLIAAIGLLVGIGGIIWLFM